MTDTLFPVSGTFNIDLNQLQAALTALGNAPPPPPPPPPTVPGAPTIGTATLSGTTAEVAFTAPTSNGGSAITHYVASSGPLSAAGSASPIAVPGLVAGTSYAFAVAAVNAVGTSVPSALSNTVEVPAVTPPAGAWNGYIVQDGVLNPWWNGGLAPVNPLAGAPSGNWNNGCTTTQESGYVQIAPTAGAQFMEALPHPPGVANNPSGNGIAIDLVNAEGVAFTEVSLTLESSVEIGQLTFQIFQVPGFGSYLGANKPTEDTLLGQAVIGENIPANTMTTLTLLLSACNFPNKAVPTPPLTAAPTWEYKNGLQVNNPANGAVLKIYDWHFQ